MTIEELAILGRQYLICKMSAQNAFIQAREMLEVARKAKYLKESFIFKAKELRKRAKESQQEMIDIRNQLSVILNGY